MVKVLLDIGGTERIRELRELPRVGETVVFGHHRYDVAHVTHLYAVDGFQPPAEYQLALRNPDTDLLTRGNQSLKELKILLSAQRTTSEAKAKIRDPLLKTYRQLEERVGKELQPPAQRLNDMTIFSSEGAAELQRLISVYERKVIPF